ncbi:MAG: molybdopterin cofactor-binding domain-containing protein [Acidimicrobiales bacterium]
MTGTEGMLRSELPASLAKNPRLGQWLRFDRAGFVELKPGKVELGQGIATALAQLAADELAIGVDQVRVLPASTAYSPDEGRTAGSRSIEESGAAIRQVCAEVRSLFLAAAREVLGEPDDQLRTENGRIIGAAGATTSYWELAESVSLDRQATGATTPRPIGTGGHSGRSASRSDLEAKVRGRGVYIQNLVVPGMLHGRVVRPPSPYGRLTALEAVELDGITIVRDGSFLGVLAEDETRAIEAATEIGAAATWDTAETLPDAERLSEFMKSAPSDTQVLSDFDDAAHADADAGAVLRAEYSRPFIAHASMGPSCAVAVWEDGALRVWCSTQGVFNLRRELARALNVAADRITVEYREGSGCYGHNGSDDAAYEAALMARHAEGRPVRLQWMREEELGWAPYGPAAVADLQAALDPEGRIRTWSHELWTYGSRGRPGFSAVGPAFWAASQLREPFAREASHLGGAIRNVEPGYAIPSTRIVAHRLTDMGLRTSSLRSLGAHLNVFAIESFMDELADSAGCDPIEFRLRHLDDPRGRTVVERAAEAAGWGRHDRPDDHGIGVGYARYKGSAGYCAVVAEVEARTRLRVLHLTIAVDVGFVVNPDGLENQVGGGAIQAVSWTTQERVRFSRERIEADSWESYPILRFTDAPSVNVAAIDRPTDPPMGAGEIAQGPTAAAVGNALYNAIGVRVRDLPITFDAILRAADI